KVNKALDTCCISRRKLQTLPILNCAPLATCLFAETASSVATSVCNCIFAASSLSATSFIFSSCSAAATGGLAGIVNSRWQCGLADGYRDAADGIKGTGIDTGIPRRGAAEE